jgi:OMF family outer membrane factor
MQPSHPLVAISIGAVIALISASPAYAQTTSSHLSLTKLAEGDRTTTRLIELERKSEQNRSFEIDATDIAQQPANPEPAPTAPSPSSPETLDSGTDSTAELEDGSIPSQEPALEPDGSAPAILDAPPTEDRTAIPAPDYLNPNPNPLTFPTQPEEVEIVGVQPITLEQAIELARRNNQELQIAELELERSRAQLREQRAELLPSVTGQANLDVVEIDRPEVIDPITREVQPGEGDDASIMLSGALRVDYDLFTSGRRSALIQAAAAQVRFQELQVEAFLEELILNVTNAYYDLQQADEQVRIARTTVDQAQQSLQDAQALEEAGVGTRFDVLSAEVELANFQQDLVQSISEQRASRRRLARQLNLSQSVSISAADPVEVVNPWGLSLPETIVLAYRNRAELQQQLLQREISDQQRRAALAEVRPQLSAFAQYRVDNILSEPRPNQTDWRDEYSLGLQLQWRLYDGGAARASADQEEANIGISESQFADTRDEIRLDVEEAFFDFEANEENIDTARLGVDQARESLRLARSRFQAGVGTQVEVLEAQTDLAQAELDLVQAIIGYNRSVAELQRAVSNLPDGYLNDVP